MASNLAKIIDGTPTVTDQQKIDLGINVRATPSPAPPPGSPYKFDVSLSPDGSVVLKWKCDNPPGTSGTLYQVWRQVGTGELDYAGGAGEKKFTDTKIPAGAAIVTYVIQAVRSTSIGIPATFVVKFGTNSTGELTTVASIEEKPAKKAA
jgi:hypothetical protein